MSPLELRDEAYNLSVLGLGVDEIAADLELTPESVKGLIAETKRAMVLELQMPD